MIKSITERTDEKNLPKGWAWGTLDDICSKIVDGTHFTPQYTDSGIPFISVKDIKNYRISFDNCKYISEKQHNNLSLRCNPEYDDVLITKSGTIGRTAVVKSHENFSLFVSVALLKPIKKYIISEYLALSLVNYINSIDIQQDVKGGVIKNLHIEDLRLIPILLSPLDEQKRIVSKIEELFSKLDTIFNDITKIKLQLTQYKKSLLQNVFSGQFTSEWRKFNRPDILGNSLIELSLQQRRELYVNQTKNSESGGRYCEPVNPKLSELPEIPESWSWASFEQISERVTVGYVGTMKNEYVPSGIPFLRSQNVRENEFDPKGLKFINAPFHTKLSKSKLIPRDIVVVRSGSVGVSCVIPENLSDVNCSDVLIIKNPLVINPYFGSHYLNSIKDSRVQQEKVGITLTHFNTKSLAKLAIPIPPREEQEIIVKELQRKFSFMYELGKVQEKTINDIMRLKKTILRSAFEGRLVPQNPNDEPAETLLEKIKQEKQTIISQAQKTRARKNV